MALNPTNQHKGGIIRRNSDSTYDAAYPLGDKPASSAPDAIDDLSLDSIGSTSASLSWTLPDNTDNVEIHQRDVTAAGSFALIDTVGAVTSYNATGLTAENEYDWKAVAKNAVGSAADSNVVNGTTGAAGGFEVSGTIEHGEIITITDSEARFGTRANVKPLYVNLGDAKAGNALGRDTGDYWPGAAEVTANFAQGSLASTIRYDLKVSTNSFEGVVLPDPTKPVIQYISRYHEFDTTLSQWQNGSGGFNLKTNRYNTSGGTHNNLYLGYQGAEGGNGRVAIENVDGNVSHFYGSGRPPGFEHLDEEFIMRNASGALVHDGGLLHYRNNTLMNPDDNLLPTFESGDDLLKRCVLSQVSNGCGSGVANVWEYHAYLCWDDEYSAVYVGDNADRASCTRLVRLPQTAWAAGSVSIHLVESAVTLSGAWLHIRTGLNSWVNDTVQI